VVAACEEPAAYDLPEVQDPLLGPTEASRQGIGVTSPPAKDSAVKVGTGKRVYTVVGTRPSRHGTDVEVLEGGPGTKHDKRRFFPLDAVHEVKP
jgi:hypothetical protein